MSERFFTASSHHDKRPEFSVTPLSFGTMCAAVPGFVSHLPGPGYSFLAYSPLRKALGKGTDARLSPRQVSDILPILSRRTDQIFWSAFNDSPHQNEGRGELRSIFTNRSEYSSFKR